MLAILLILVFLAVTIYLFFVSSHKKYQVDDDLYLIEKNKRKDESLTTLVQVRQKLEKLVNHMTSRFPENSKVVRMEQRFRDTVLKEANPRANSDQTSYTINKGDVMVLCIRNKGGKIVPINTLMYVAIHELAHIYSSTLYHTEEFWKNMKFLLEEAVKAGIYVAQDYKSNPVPYCGMEIDNNIN